MSAYVAPEDIEPYQFASTEILFVPGVQIVNRRVTFRL